MEGADDKAAEEKGAESRKPKRRGARPRGLHYERKMTRAGTDPLDEARYEKRTSVITNTDGSVVFKMEGVEVPAGWSQLATDIIVSKYFRKAGLYGDKAQGETSARQVVYRIAHTIRDAGERFGGYFASSEDADSFEADLSYFLLHQYGAFNSPVWFNCGLYHEYNIKGAGGNYAWNPVAPSDSSEEIYAIDNNYERPQCSACFIQAVNDDLMSIYDLVKSEAKLFKYGSGCTSGDARIYVEGRGMLPIRDLYATLSAEGRQAREFDGNGRYLDVSDLKIHTLSMDPQTGEYQRDHVEKVWQYDVAADDKITLRFDTGARATVSKWHPFLVWNGEEVVERRADQLGRGDAVLATNESALAAMRKAPATVHYTSTYFGKTEEHAVTIDTDLAWLCGYFLGDGSFGEIKSSTTNPQGRRYTYDRLRLRFHDESEAALKRVQAIVARAFGEHGEIQDDGRGGKGRQVCFTGRYVTGFFAALFEPGPKTQSLPSFLWQAERPVALAFLAGLLDSDGEVSGGCARYASSSRAFASDVGVLASLHGLGGGFNEHRSASARSGEPTRGVVTVTIVRELTGEEARADLAAFVAHPERKRRLLDVDPPAERQFYMPLAKRLVEHLLGSTLFDGSDPEGSERAPNEWLRMQIADEIVHLGRLRHEGLVHPRNLARVIEALGRDDFAWLRRIAQSLAFVSEVEPCEDNPDFYDLTVAHHENYLAGEAGLVAIHNTGTNFSAIRSKHEKLSGGGTSSGLMSFLEVLDRAAGATKSGGTTRRAAKMVCLDMDHPEIVDFIQWKVREERKAKDLIAAGYDGDFNGEAYHTVSGQNSNNSVRVTDKFMRAATLSHGSATAELLAGELLAGPAPSGGKVPSDAWRTTARTTGDVIEAHSASQLWRMIAEAAWECADPGVQYDSTINNWHTCPNTDRIRASNPCSEYMFLDDSACNLSSLNLTKFLREDNSFDVELYRHAVRVFFTAMEILVDLSSYPTRQIAKNSHDYRPLGLGYANLGTLLMRLGLPYDSDEGRALAAAVTSILCGHAYRTSAEMASSKGAFAGYAKNEQPMLRVMGMHRDAAYEIDRDKCPEALWRAAIEDWDIAVDLGKEHGYRNSQATVLAPTGTIGLLMDCDTTGVEPDFSLVKFKKLAGGGYFKIVNQSVPAALETLGYAEHELQEIVAYISGTNTLLAAPHVNRAKLLQLGLTKEELAKVEAALPSVFDLAQAFAPWVIGEAAYERLGVPGYGSRGDTQPGGDKKTPPKMSLLRHLGFSSQAIQEASDHIVGRMTIEGAPHLKDEHLPVFDCANRCGRLGKRYLAPMAHVHMMAAVQPFISGAISKTINLPNEATVDDVQQVYEEGWRLGLKAVALYRDGCKASQPLSTKDDGKKDDDDKVEAKKEPRKEAVKVEPVAVENRPVENKSVENKAPLHPTAIRVRLPRKRTGFTQEARVGGHKIFLRTGEYLDGTLGEIFIDMHKEGAAFRSLMNCFAMSVSIGLQYGVPLATYVDQYTFTRFEPQGSVEGHDNIKFATSIVDYVFRVLGVEYLSRYDLAHVVPAPAPIEDPSDTHAAQPAAPPAEEAKPLVTASLDEGASSLDQQLEDMMGDAPVCDACGHITVRNGACYKCLNCGNSLGCS